MSVENQGWKILDVTAQRHLHKICVLMNSPMMNTFLFPCQLNQNSFSSLKEKGWQCSSFWHIKCTPPFLRLLIKAIPLLILQLALVMKSSTTCSRSVTLVWSLVQRSKCPLVSTMVRLSESRPRHHEASFTLQEVCAGNRGPNTENTTATSLSSWLIWSWFV